MAYTKTEWAAYMRNYRQNGPTQYRQEKILDELLLLATNLKESEKLF